MLLNEDFCSQISGALYYNNFLTINGYKDFKPSLSNETLNKIPNTLHKFLQIRYRFKMQNEPYIQFIKGNNIRIAARLRVYIWMLEGLEIKFDASLVMVTPFKLDDPNDKFKIVLKNADIQEFKIDYKYNTESNVSIQMDLLFENALHSYFNDSNQSYSIDLPKIDNELPYIREPEKNKIPVDIKVVKTVGNGALVVAANIFDYQGGNESQLHEFVKNCNIGLGIAERAMNKVYDFYWEHTSIEKSYFKSGSFKIDMADKVLNGLTEFVNFFTWLGSKLVSFGFIEASIDYISSDFLYSIDIDFKTKPTFDILDGNRVRIYNLGVDLTVKLSMYTTFIYTVEFDTSGPVPDKCTPWNDDIVLKKEKKTRRVFSIGIPIRNLEITNCIGHIYINEEKKCLECKVEELEINLYRYVDAACDFLMLPQSIQDKIMDGMRKKVVDSIPTIVLSPTVFELKIDQIDWPVCIEGKKLEVTDHEAIVGARIYFKEMQNQVYPVPKYIVNKNNKEIHRIGCDSVNDTYETHQEGYYLLHDAIKHNNDGCKKCLPAFHKR